jgi:hypothetical protein
MDFKVYFKRTKFRTDKHINKFIIVIRMVYKTIAISEQNHAKLESLKFKLKCLNYNDVISRLIEKQGGK